MHAQPGGLAVPVGERHVEHLHVHLADVAAHPLLENVDQEASILLAADRAPRHELAALLVQRTVAPGGPWHGAVKRRLGHALDDRDELDIASAAVVAQEPVDIYSAIGVCRVERRQRVELDSRLAQVSEPSHDLLEAAPAALG